MGLGEKMADFNEGDVVRLGAVQEFDAAVEVVGVLHVVLQDATFLPFAAAAQDFQEYCDALYALYEASTSDLQLPKHISVKNITQAAVWGNIAWNIYSGGTNVADPTAPQVALLAWGRTSISRVQMRKYLGVGTEVEMTGGTWLAAARTRGQAFIDYHITPQTMGNGLILRGCAYKGDIARVTYAVTGTTSANPVIQRRRRRGRGS